MTFQNVLTKLREELNVAISQVEISKDRVNSTLNDYWFLTTQNWAETHKQDIEQKINKIEEFLKKSNVDQGEETGGIEFYIFKMDK